MDATRADSVADALLRPTVCPRCDYPLTGLPAGGTCPECGRVYGMDEVFLFGHPHGHVTRRLWRPPLSRVRVALSPAGVAVGEQGLGATPFEAADRLAPMPWSDVTAFAIQPRADDQARLGATFVSASWRVRQPWVDLVVRCPAAALPALGDRVARWRVAAWGREPELEVR